MLKRIGLYTWITITLLLVAALGVFLVRLPVLHLTIAFYVLVVGAVIAMITGVILSRDLMQAYILHRIGAQENFNDARALVTLNGRSRAFGHRSRLATQQVATTPSVELLSGDYRTVGSIEV